MTRDAREVPASLWDAPPPRLRRDQHASGLPVAVPVEHAASAPAANRRRLIAGFAAVAAIGAATVTAGVLATAAPFAAAPVADVATEAESVDPPSAASLAGEGGAHGSDLRPLNERTEPAPPAAEEPEPRLDAGSGHRPDAGTPEDPSVGVQAPGTDAPSPADPGPSTPAPAPAPPAPTPPAPAPPPQAPPTPEAPEPLAFTGLAANHAVNLLGITLLSSYTLSVSGEPGATASVTYGGRSAGSMTFGPDGRASLRIGGSLLGLTNPMVRVAYSDGTAGAVIEARRDSI